MNLRSGKTIVVLGLIGMTGALSARQASSSGRIAVVFSGGHETDRRDHGRPVVLVAAALGVPSEVFREAFTHVTPSRSGPPTGDQARQNKRALLDALGRYGVTNERLDQVSNYYRYRPQEGELWPTKPARAFAIVEEGKIVRFEVTDPGSGYSSPPTVQIPGYESVQAKTTLVFGKKLEKNGAVGAISLAPRP